MSTVYIASSSFSTTVYKVDGMNLTPFEGTIYVGDTVPIGSYNISVTVNTPTNTMYFNKATNKFYSPNLLGLAISSWTDVSRIIRIVSFIEPYDVTTSFTDAVIPTENLYAPPATWEADIYIVNKTDLIASGITGANSLGNIGLEKRTKHLKKEQASFIRGIGTPSGSYDYIIDNDLVSNLFYMDETTGSFYQPIVTGTAITGWTNVSKDFVLYVQGLQLNQNGDTSSFIDFRFEPNNTGETSLVLYDPNNDLADIRVRKIVYQEATSITKNMIEVKDNEIISNNDTTNETQNSTGGFLIGHVTPINLTDKRFFEFNEARNIWVCRKEDATPIPMNAGHLYVNNVPFPTTITSEEEVACIITNQSEFDAVFDNAGVTKVIPDAHPTNSITIKRGTYTLANSVDIQRSFMRIRCMPGAQIRMTGTSGETYCFRTYNVAYCHLDLNIDINDLSYVDIIDMTNANLCVYKLHIVRCSLDCTLFTSITGAYNRIELADSFNHFDGTAPLFSGLLHTTVKANVNCISFTDPSQFFAFCTGILFKGTLNGSQIIGPLF